MEHSLEHSLNLSYPPVRRLVVRGKDWHVNISVTSIVREESVVFAYMEGALVGMFDLGAVDALYTSDRRYEEK